MPLISIMPMQRKVELPLGSRLTDIEFECHGEELIPFGCRRGACGACAVEVMDGHSRLGQMSENERVFLNCLGFSPDTHRLACQSRLLGDATIRIIDPVSRPAWNRTGRAGR